MKDMKSTWRILVECIQTWMHENHTKEPEWSIRIKSTGRHKCRINAISYEWNRMNVKRMNESVFFMNLHESVSESGMERMLELNKVNVKSKQKYWWKKEKMKIFFRKKSMQFTNPNAHTYVNGTDVETHGNAVTQHTFLKEFIWTVLYMFPLLPCQCTVGSGI